MLVSRYLSPQRLSNCVPRDAEPRRGRHGKKRTTAGNSWLDLSFCLVDHDHASGSPGHDEPILTQTGSRMPINAGAQRASNGSAPATK